MFPRSDQANAAIVRDILNKADTDQLCLMLIRRHQSSTHATFLFQTGIRQDHIRTYQNSLIASDPHINNSEAALRTKRCYSSVISLEDSHKKVRATAPQSTEPTSVYHHYLLDEGIFHTAIYSKRLTQNSMILVGLLSDDRRKRIRLDASMAVIENWIDACCDSLLDDGMRFRQFQRAEPSRCVSSSALLTPRERDVVQLLCSGLSNKQIAHALARSENTVENHLRNIYKKYGVHNRASLMAVVRMH